MSQATQFSTDSIVRTIEFTQLSAHTSASGYLEGLCKVFGVVYVTSITRDGCSGCAEQKPLFRELASEIGSKQPDLFSFSNIHIRYSEGDVSQSSEAKKTLRHAAYPTYTIHVKSRFGPLEVYRAIYPSMEELEKQIREAAELAEYYKTDAEKLTS